MTSKLVVGSKLVVSKLVAASASGDVARVRELVVGSKSAATAEAAALFAAAEHDHAEVITVLRDAGAQQAKQPCGQTATWAAASVGHVDCVRALGGDAVDEVDDVCGIAPVLIASVAGFAGVVGALHSLGADLAAVDDQGNTALHLAAQHAHVDLVRALPALGADIEARNSAGQTPLFVAAQAPSNGLDASSSSSSSSSSATTTTTTSSSARIEVLRALFELGAELEAPCAHGVTPLQIATMQGEVATVRALHAMGAAVGVGATVGAIHLAALQGNAEMIQALHGLGADLRAPAGRCAVCADQFAERGGHHDAARLLRELVGKPAQREQLPSPTQVQSAFN